MATSTDDIVEAISTRLSGNLPALVTAQSLEAVTEYLNYDPGLPTATKAPQVWVDVASDSRSADSRRGASVNKYSRQLEILVGVTVAGADAAEAARRHRKYVDLIIECLEGDQTPGTAQWLLWQRTDYSPNFGQGFALFREAVLHFDANPRRALGTN